VSHILRHHVAVESFEFRTYGGSPVPRLQTASTPPEIVRLFAGRPTWAWPPGAWSERCASSSAGQGTTRQEALCCPRSVTGPRQNSALLIPLLLRLSSSHLDLSCLLQYSCWLLQSHVRRADAAAVASRMLRAGAQSIRQDRQATSCHSSLLPSSMARQHSTSSRGPSKPARQATRKAMQWQQQERQRISPAPRSTQQQASQRSSRRARRRSLQSSRSLQKRYWAQRRRACRGWRA
jgi:hypothetical protein